MRKLVSFLSFQFVFLAAAAAFAQNPTPTPPSSVDDTSKTFEVRLPVTVTDKKNNLVWCTDPNKNKPDVNEKDKKKTPIQCFTKDDFVVLEDGVPQELTFFTDEKNNPALYVGVLMDTSPSTAGKMAFSKRAASDFLYTVVRLRKDKGAFMTFDHEPNLIQDFTDKLDLLDKAVDKVKKVGSQTALYDAIWEFTNEKLRNAPGRRVIVVITDGDDTFSRANLNDAIDIAQRTETTIFGISTNEKGGEYLTRLCEETGGEAFFTADMNGLEKAIAKISKELQSQYILTYRPANQNYDGRKRKIEVRFKKRKNANYYRIRSKTEYRSVKDTLK
jgi:Ca-activated chloride channel family protein